MLTLARRRNETIVIDGRITVKVFEIRPGVVRLGVDAPRDVTVHRGEVQERIDQQNRKAATK